MRWIFRQFTVYWTKISYWGHKTKRGLPTFTVYCHGIRFLAQVRCRFQNAIIPWIFRQFTVHWTKISYWRQNETKRGIAICLLLSRYTFFSQKIRCRFSVWLGFWGRTFFVVVAKKQEQHIHPLSESTHGLHDQATQSTWQTQTTRSHQDTESSNWR